MDFGGSESNTEYVFVVTILLLFEKIKNSINIILNQNFDTGWHRSSKCCCNVFTASCHFDFFSICGSSFINFLLVSITLINLNMTLSKLGRGLFVQSQRVLIFLCLQSLNYFRSIKYLQHYSRTK